ncbi:MAG: type II toxin-antitoxin system VapC family toxin [Chloroflexota bacterium]
MEILIDTHIFLWFIIDAPQLKKAMKVLIEHPDNNIHLSMASLWEIAIKHSRGKLDLPTSFETFVPHQVEVNNMSILPINVEHLHKVALLPFHHRDPFDRLLIAQATVEDMYIMSRDASFEAYAINNLWYSSHK